MFYTCFPQKCARRVSRKMPNGPRKRFQCFSVSMSHNGFLPHRLATEFPKRPRNASVNMFYVSVFQECPTTAAWPTWLYFSHPLVPFKHLLPARDVHSGLWVLYVFITFLFHHVSPKKKCCFHMPGLLLSTKGLGWPRTCLHFNVAGDGMDQFHAIFWMGLETMFYSVVPGHAFVPFLRAWFWYVLLNYWHYSFLPQGFREKFPRLQHNALFSGLRVEGGFARRCAWGPDAVLMGVASKRALLKVSNAE
jgi:hypothetical protein